MSEPRKLDLNTIALAAGVGLFGFLANDWAEDQSRSTVTVEATVREVLTLKLEPLIADFGDLQDDFEKLANEISDDTEELRRRMSALEARAALDERSLETVVDRIDRISAILRDGIKGETP